MTIVTGEQSRAIAKAALEQSATTMAAIAYLELISEQVSPELEPVLAPMLEDVKARIVNTIDALQAVLPEEQRKDDIFAYVDDFITNAKQNGDSAVLAIKRGMALQSAINGALDGKALN